MTGKEYADRIASYINHNYGNRGLKVLREVFAGKSIIGKNRRVDIFLFHQGMNEAFAIECKYQSSSGTIDEKIVYALNDIQEMWMKGCIVYAGDGFSKGVLSHLEGTKYAAYCLPENDTASPSKSTRELDHILAMHFKFWDVIIGKPQKSLFA